MARRAHKIAGRNALQADASHTFCRLPEHNSSTSMVHTEEDLTDRKEKVPEGHEKKAI